MDTAAYNTTAINPSIAAAQFATTQLRDRLSEEDNKGYALVNRYLDRIRKEAVRGNATRKARFTPSSKANIGQRFLGFIIGRQNEGINAIENQIKGMDEKLKQPMGDEYYQVALSTACQNLMKVLDVKDRREKVMRLRDEIGGSRPIKLYEKAVQSSKMNSAAIDRYLRSQGKSIDVSSVNQDTLGSQINSAFTKEATALSIPGSTEVATVGEMDNVIPQFPSTVIDDSNISKLPNFSGMENSSFGLPDKSKDMTTDDGQRDSTGIELPEVERDSFDFSDNLFNKKEDNSSDSMKDSYNVDALFQSDDTSYSNKEASSLSSEDISATTDRINQFVDKSSSVEDLEKVSKYIEEIRARKAEQAQILREQKQKQIEEEKATIEALRTRDEYLLKLQEEAKMEEANYHQLAEESKKVEEDINNQQEQRQQALRDIEKMAALLDGGSNVSKVSNGRRGK